jgi:hypothetical protein
LELAAQFENRGGTVAVALVNQLIGGERSWGGRSKR